MLLQLICFVFRNAFHVICLLLALFFHTLPTKLRSSDYLKCMLVADLRADLFAHGPADSLENVSVYMMQRKPPEVESKLALQP